MTQANPRFENHWPPGAKQRYFALFRGVRPPDPAQPTGYDDYIKTLAEEMEGYDKPVAFLHGDTHLHRVDKPLYSKKTNRIFENFTRVETFGNPDTHWVRISVDPADPQLFSFKAEIIPRTSPIVTPDDGPFQPGRENRQRQFAAALTGGSGGNRCSCYQPCYRLASWFNGLKDPPLQASERISRLCRPGTR